MKSQLSFPILKLPKLNKHAFMALTLAFCSIFLLSTLGALNGGTALMSSVWDVVQNWIQHNLLASTFLLVLAFIALLVGVWRLAHGQGYSTLSWVLGILAVGIIGPSFVISMSTATGEINSISVAPVSMTLNQRIGL